LRKLYSAEAVWTSDLLGFFVYQFDFNLERRFRDTALQQKTAKQTVAPNQ
jgi:hypothetical protein